MWAGDWALAAGSAVRAGIVSRPAAGSHFLCLSPAGLMPSLFTDEFPMLCSRQHMDKIFNLNTNHQYFIQLGFVLLTECIRNVMFCSNCKPGNGDMHLDWAGLYKYAGIWACPIYLWEWATHCTWAPGCASGFEIERTKRIVHIKEGEIRETGEGRNSIKQAKSNPYCSAVSDLTMVLENQFLPEKNPINSH